MYVNLVQEIRRLREEKRFTQQEVADKLNMSRQRYARIENGAADISIAFLEGFAPLVGKTVTELTSVLDGCNSVGDTAFRTSTANEADSFDEINEMLDLFYANKHLYERVNVQNDKH